MPEISSDAAEILIEALLEKIKKYKEEESVYAEIWFSAFCFFTSDEGKDALVPFIKFAYREHRDIAKRAVQGFHDETIDLSTLDCSRPDFAPWKE